MEETHHGVFDIAMLRHIPNMILSQPKDAKEAQNLLYSAFQQKEHPYAIRYPRGNVPFEKAKKNIHILNPEHGQAGHSMNIAV